MNLIVCVDKNWGIGNRGELLVNIPADKRYFKELTMGGVVLGGRRTMEGLPEGKPLKGRTNVVLTSQSGYQFGDGIVVHNVAEARKTMESFPAEKRFLIGGGMVYQAFLPYCDCAYITKVDAVFEADTFFPNLDTMEGWRMVQESAVQKDQGLAFRFCQYCRVK